MEREEGSSLKSGTIRENLKYWYIWLSIIGFGILWLDTARRIIYARIVFGEGADLWNGALKNMFGLFILYVMAPTLLLSFLAHILFEFIPEDFILVERFTDLLMVIRYFGGVYITYKHAVWRKKNLFHKI